MPEPDPDFAKQIHFLAKPKRRHVLYYLGYYIAQDITLYTLQLGVCESFVGEVCTAPPPNKHLKKTPSGGVFY
jgi:hypothetical protein